MSEFSQALKQLFQSQWFSEPQRVSEAEAQMDWANYLGRKPEVLDSWLADASLPSPSDVFMLRGLTDPDSIYDSRRSDWARSFETTLQKPIAETVSPENIPAIERRAAEVNVPTPATMLEYAKLPIFRRPEPSKAHEIENS